MLRRWVLRGRVRGLARQEFLPALQAGIAVAQPDLSHAGGITEVRKIASLAELYDVQLAPHCRLGPLALAACLQVGWPVPAWALKSTRPWSAPRTSAATPGAVRSGATRTEHLQNGKQHD